MRKYRIKSNIRFITFLVISILIVTTTVTTLLGVNTVNSLTDQQYLTVEVESGDTLWAIADKYAPEDQDLRHVVYDIRNLNNLDASDINSGDRLQIPVYD